MWQIKTTKSLQKIHAALLMSQLIFMALAGYLIYSKTLNPPLQAQDQLLQISVLLLSIAGFYLGTFVILKNKITTLRKDNLTVNKKFIGYFDAVIIQWLMLTVPGLFASFSFLLVGNFSFLALAITIMLLFVMMGATKAKTMLLLQLTEDDYLEI